MENAKIHTWDPMMEKNMLTKNLEEKYQKLMILIIKNKWILFLRGITEKLTDGKNVIIVLST